MQVVGYDRASEPGDVAALRVASDGTVDRIRLAPGDDLAYRLGDRHCAGSVDADGHHACPVSDAPYCPDHVDRWPCAVCTGECAMPLDSCHEEHAIYLAAFAPTTFKVGVTRSWRLETRLREQGADRAAHLRTVDDGRIARQIEADIATDVGDRVRVPSKIRGFHESVDDEGWAALLEKYDPVDTFAFDYGFSLAEQPMTETFVTGEVVGTKGRVLVLSYNGSTYAVDMRSLVGYELESGRTDRNLQASLGAFG
ncbi:DUF2797 domain-containing protein [Haloarculaceae archaeon H-GB2-1]|nr:DUF2797 domain-containing protein [Haloarculaceae archaeon H-GB1-1]MEA5408801.1 DUF2797 domain-containing protein [Haloarculaceae archaeon H-GB2-1]